MEAMVRYRLPLLTSFLCLSQELSQLKSLGWKDSSHCTRAASAGFP